MTGAEIRITLDDAPLNAALQRLVALGQDLSPLMSGIAAQLEAGARGRFETETAPDGTPWKPSRRAILQGGQTLSRSGRLKASLSAAFGPHEAVAGSNVVYAAVHQFGFDGDVTVRAHRRLVSQIFGRRLKQRLALDVKTHKRRMRLPARPYLGVSAEDEAEIRGHIVSALQRAAGGGA